MSLTLYYHPLSSYCQKALVALYENDTPFEKLTIDLGNPESRAKLTALWPIGKFPLLRDEAKDRTVPEATIIIEYLAQHYSGASPLIPADPDLARQTRMRDRFFDLYVNDTVGKIVTDRIRPADKTDPYGVEQAKERLRTAYAMIDQDMASKTWAIGEHFTMADCAAAPPLFFANKLIPFGDHKNLAAYFDRLTQRPSYARAAQEAEPYLIYFPN